jgi:hypothetical protein|tara:strand:+ start:95 stop:217 length:123 start_codon:yes stop_codon:yes gene_type:complete
MDNRTAEASRAPSPERTGAPADGEAEAVAGVEEIVQSPVK